MLQTIYLRSENPLELASKGNARVGDKRIKAEIFSWESTNMSVKEKKKY
jgi:hypothetical protein